jgi:hypothetical protein
VAGLRGRIPLGIDDLCAHPVDVLQKAQILRLHELKAPRRTSLAAICDDLVGLGFISADDVDAEALAGGAMRRGHGPDGAFADAIGSADADGNQWSGLDDGGVVRLDDADGDHHGPMQCSERRVQVNNRMLLYGLNSKTR